MILEQLRKSIKAWPESRYAISKQAGIDESVLWRIAHGGGCSLATADKLCKHLGLELKPKGKTKGR